MSSDQMVRRRWRGPFQLNCWGEFALADHTGRACTPGSRKARALIAFLAARPDAPIPRETPASLLWGDREDAHARASLRQCLHELRQLVECACPLLAITNGDVMLRAAALADGCAPRDEPVAQAIQRLSAQINRGSGVLYSDLSSLSESFDDWLAGERMRRRAALVDEALRLADAALSAGLVQPAREMVGLLETLDPLNERVARLGLRVDAEVGDRAALETRYRRLKTRMNAELQVAPAPETDDLHDRLLAPSPRSPALPPPVRLPASEAVVAAGDPPESAPASPSRAARNLSLALGMLIGLVTAGVHRHRKRDSD